MIEDLRKDIEQLISLYETEKHRGDELAAKLVVKESEAAKYKQQITELTKQIDRYTLAGAFTADGDKAAAKERIDKLIREIDKCIRPPSPTLSVYCPCWSVFCPAHSGAVRTVQAPARLGWYSIPIRTNPYSSVLCPANTAAAPPDNRVGTAIYTKSKYK